MKCAICDKQRNDLKRKNSAIMTKTVLLVCTECFNNGLEPRWIVALGARAGNDIAKRYIVNKLYPGDEISAKELLG